MTAEMNARNNSLSATSAWTAEALAGLKLDHTNQAPIISAEKAKPMSPDLDVWDAWPLADPKGCPVEWKGGQLWFALAVPRAQDPEQRHHLARIHQFHRKGDQFEHVGETMPRDNLPGARQWSGSARYEKGMITLFFTAAGREGDQDLTYHQRIFSASAPMDDAGEIGEWSIPVEIVEADGELYRPANENTGEPGKIKAFRDPAHFRDHDGSEYLLFTGSSAQYPGSHDGVIGLASHRGDGIYAILPPLLEAVDTSNELERPHIVEHAGALYLFWSTQRGVFAPGITAPTGLYGATAKSLSGPWSLLNGTGLVLANPGTRPTQAYSWWVLPDLSVTSFVDYWGLEDPAVSEIDSRRARFGGTFAPFVRIALDGSSSMIISDDDG